MFFAVLCPRTALPRIGQNSCWSTRKGIIRCTSSDLHQDYPYQMIKWQNGFLGVSKAAALGWARGPGKRSERREFPLYDRRDLQSHLD